MEAVNEVDLELRLKRMGLDLITATEVDRQTSSVAGTAKIDSIAAPQLKAGDAWNFQTIDMLLTSQPNMS